MLSSKIFLARVRKLPDSAKHDEEIDKLAASYHELVTAARQVGSRRVPADPQAVIRKHLNTILAGGAKAQVALRETARLYNAAASVNASASRRQVLNNKAGEAVA